MPLYERLYNFALRLKVGTEHLAYGRPIIRNWAAESAAGRRDGPFRILDLGCGRGDDLMNIKPGVKQSCELFGIEYNEDYIKECKEKGIETRRVDLERDVYPYEDEFFDVVIANQIMEHTKEVFFLVSEISRILKKGGTLIVGVPNLAAWHDRLILLLGQQPSGIKLPGPHVRGITKPALRQFLECGGFFKLRDFRGSGFYPFPAALSHALARLFPSWATAVFFKFERTPKEGVFIEVLKDKFYDTNYYTGLDSD